MAVAPVFEAVIKASDQTAGVFERIQKALQSVGLAARESEGELQGMSRAVTRFGAAGAQIRAVSGHVRALRGHFDMLAGAIGGAHSKLTSLLPVLGGLASLGSVAGVFHLVEHVSERRNEQIKQARDLGITTSQLGAITYAARVADVNADEVTPAVARLERNISMTARGKNKDLAGLFKHLNISLRDQHGNLRSATDLLPDIADAIKNTKSADQRQDMTQALFGRSGRDLVGFLAQGGGDLRKNLRDVEGVGMTTKTDDDFRAFNRSMVTLNSAVKGVTNTIAAILAPALKPVVDLFSKWLIENRELIGQNLKGALTDIGNALKSVDWAWWGNALRDAFDGVRWLVDRLGGLKIILEALIAIRVFDWVMGAVSGFIRYGAAIAKVAESLTNLRKAQVAEVATEAVADAEGGAAAAGGAAAGAGGKGVADVVAKAGLGAVLGRTLAAALRGGLPAAAFIAAFDGGGLNKGERDLNDDPEVRKAYLRALRVPAFPGEKPGLAPAVRVFPEDLPQFPRIVVPMSDGARASMAALSKLLHVSGGGLPIDAGGQPNALSDPWGTLPRLYPGGITVPQGPPPVRGQVDVTVNIPNLPSGASVLATARGDARVSTNTGKNYPDADVSLGDLGLHF